MNNDLIEKLARKAAELINGGEFYDGKWYSEGHREAWRKAMKPAADRIEALELALRSIAANTCCDKCQEAALVARTALGEKKDD